MSATVRIPSQLRPLSGGAGELELEGSTVGEVLNALDSAHPGFADRLFEENGNIRAHLPRYPQESDKKHAQSSKPHIYSQLNALRF